MALATSVSIIEDDKATIKRLTKILTASQAFSLGFSCSTLEQSKQHLISNPCDILLLDIGLPDGNGIDLIHFIRAKNLKTQVIILSIFADEKHIINAISAGAIGYLLKDEEHQSILASLTQVVQGGSPVSPSIARHLLKHFHSPNINGHTPLDNQHKTHLLTNREVEILQEVSKGFTCKEISEIECLSYHTVATHIRNIYKKLSVNSKAEALFEAYQMGLL